MNYTKPEVMVLGEAARVIDALGIKLFHLNFDAFLLHLIPAYDLEE